jgi:hypothetical protein
MSEDMSTQNTMAKPKSYVTSFSQQMMNEDMSTQDTVNCKETRIDEYYVFFTKNDERGYVDSRHRFKVRTIIRGR